MAQVKTVQLVDDLTGESADETVDFGIDGRGYEIELSEANAGRLRDALAVYVSAARRRRVSGGVRVGGRGVRSARGQVRVIREWARAQGLPVSERGRIPADIMSAYRARKS